MVRQRQIKLNDRMNLRKCILIMITASLLLTGCGGSAQNESKAEQEVPVCFQKDPPLFHSISR